MSFKCLVASLLLAFAPIAAAATTVTIPYMFVPNTPAQSSQVNANFLSLATGINGNIDNANIGANGIYASQIIPTTLLQATFGGSQNYTFPLGIQANGNIQTSNGVYQASTSVPIQLCPNNLCGVVLPVAGGITTGTSASTTRSYVPPIYLASGAAVAGSMHGVFGTISGTLNANCTPATYCAFSSTPTANFSGAAVFTTTGYVCPTSQPTANGIIAYITPVSDTQITAAFYNSGTGTISSGFALASDYTCLGI